MIGTFALTTLRRIFLRPARRKRNMIINEKFKYLNSVFSFDDLLSGVNKLSPNGKNGKNAKDTNKYTCNCDKLWVYEWDAVSYTHLTLPTNREV